MVRYLESDERIQDYALHMLVLDEVLGLELSSFSRQLKLKPGIDDDHRVVIAMSNDLWFRAMEVTGEKARRKIPRRLELIWRRWF